MSSTRHPTAPTDDGANGKRKRNRKPVSCAECRRMKLKCDRQVPCSTCSKRGCAALCPNGALTAGPRNRFALANTEHLHEKIEAMAMRIAELEDALAKLQSHISSEQHPLLADELLFVKAPLSTQNALTTLNDESDEVTKSLGTLKLGERPRFFGSHAAVDYLLMDESLVEPATTTASSPVDIPLDMPLLAESLPIPAVGITGAQMNSKLADYLPPAEQAWTIIDQYYRIASWFFVLISKEELKETIFTRIYRSTGPGFKDVSSHDIAILFMVLACGSLFYSPPSQDTGDTRHAPNAARYYQLARVALGCDCIINHPTVQAIRALHLMASFVQMADLPNSTTSGYILLGLAARLCQSLGLHRDDTQWELSDSERQTRRRVFWEVASYDAWLSLAFGRPPSFTMAQVDAKIAEKFTNDEDLTQASLCNWVHTFSSQVLPKVIDQAFGVAPLSYATVLRLDQLVREHPVSGDMRLGEGDTEDTSLPTSLISQRCSIISLSQRLLLYMHRSFFARALKENPEDPLKSKYAQSVLAVFRAATRISSSLRTLYARVPWSLVPYYWVLWTPCFSACLVLSSILVKSPGSGLAPPALIELDEMVKLLEVVAPKFSRVARLMPSIRKLHGKAHERYATFVSDPAYVPPSCSPHSSTDDLGKLFFWGSTAHNAAHTNSPPSIATASSCSAMQASAATTVPIPGAPSISAPPTANPSVLACHPLPAAPTVAVDDSDLMQTLDYLFGVQQQPSWDVPQYPSQQSTLGHDFQAFPVQPNAGDSTLPPELEFLSTVNLSADATGFGGGATTPSQLPGLQDSDVIMNWTFPEPAPFSDMLPPREHDLAWQRFVADIGFFDMEARHNERS